VFTLPSWDKLSMVSYLCTMNFWQLFSTDHCVMITYKMLLCYLHLYLISKVLDKSDIGTPLIRIITIIKLKHDFLFFNHQKLCCQFSKPVTCISKAGTQLVLLKLLLFVMSVCMCVSVCLCVCLPRGHSH